MLVCRQDDPDQKGNVQLQTRVKSNVNYMIIDDDLSIRIECINNNVARVFLVNTASVLQPIPQPIRMTEAGGDVVIPNHNEFLISWVGTYTLYLNGQPYMILNNQREQSISGPAEAASGPHLIRIFA